MIAVGRATRHQDDGQQSRLHQNNGISMPKLGISFSITKLIEAATGAREPSRETQRVAWDSISRELRKRGASETAVRALLERVVRSLGSKTN